MLWIDEFFDIPALFLGAPPTPVNWRESLFESVLIIFVAAHVLYITNKILNEFKFLEGILPVCSCCKKIRDKDNNWQQIETFIRDRSNADFSHGLCPECIKKLYPELIQKNNETNE